MAIEVKLLVSLSSGNDAFQDGVGTAHAEVARILRALAGGIKQGKDGYFTLKDANGNGCGNASLEIWDDEEE